MAIYKSSFNKNDKPKKEKQIKEEKPEKVRTKVKVNLPLVFLCVFVLMFLVCCLPSNIFKRFLLGAFGFAVYPSLVVLSSAMIMTMKKPKLTLDKKYFAYLISILCVIWFVFHLVLTSKFEVTSFGEFMKATFVSRTTAGGVVYSVIAYPIIKYLTRVGAFVVSGIALAILVGVLFDYIMVQRNLGESKKNATLKFEEIEKFNFEPKIEEKKASKIETQKDIAKRKLGLEKGSSTIISSSMPSYEMNLETKNPISKRDYILTPLDPIIPPEESNFIFGSKAPARQGRSKNNFDTTNGNVSTSADSLYDANKKSDFGNQQYSAQNTNSIGSTAEPVNDDIDDKRDNQDNNYYYHEQENKEIDKTEYSNETNDEDDFILDDEEDLEDYTTAFTTDARVDADDDSEEDEGLKQPKYDENDVEEISTNLEEDFEEDFDEDVSTSNQYSYNKDESLGSTVDTEVIRPSVDISKFNLPNKISNNLVEDEPIVAETEKKEIPPYVAPPADILKYMDNHTRISDEELQDNIERLEQVLEDFKVPAKVNNVQVGPAVTRYELTMPRGISVNKIAQMADDIAMTLASNGSIRVEAPIPGKNSVGVEVPNAQVSPVSLRELIDSEEFRTRGNPLSFVLGRDINGDIIFCNLDKMPHLLVAGSTGSGKSVCLNTMLLSMCYKAGPQDLRLILVDPKMVEFTTYNGLPHLLIPEVITGKDMTINALDWAIKEMERRYALFAKNHNVNINDFNKGEAVRSKREEKLPYIVIVIDELADLMLEAKREMDDRIAKLAAKARAAGIHLVLATQRPSVDVITGTVKANLPSRIAFALTNYMDSKTVLDGGGAEKLLGKGDMLFKPQDKPEPRRVQGAFVSNEEIYQVVEYIKTHNNPVYDDNAYGAIKNKKDKPQGGNAGGNTKEIEFDPILKDALRMFIQTKQASGSMISRRYSVGFNRAGRIMDQMEMAGFIGPQEGSKPRQVRITMEEFKAIFGE